MTNMIARVTKTEKGWNIHLNDSEVKEFKQAHYKVEGYNQIVAGVQGGTPTDDIVIKLGEAASVLKDLGMQTAAESIPELTESAIQFNWDCDFVNRILSINLV